jgi:hypothetical protein
MILLLGSITPQVYAGRKKIKAGIRGIGYITPEGHPEQKFHVKIKMMASLNDCDTCGGYFGTAKGFMAVELPETNRIIIPLKNVIIHFIEESGTITSFTFTDSDLGQTIWASIYQDSDGEFYAEIIDAPFEFNGNEYLLFIHLYDVGGGPGKG